MTRVVLAFAASVALLAAPLTAVAQEHPEHPKAGAEQPKAAAEHPEHPKAEAAETAAKHTYTVAEMGKAIEDYVKKDSALKGGTFLVFDAQTSSVLRLTLTKIHNDKLAKVGEGIYFACSDFKATDGKTYDLDFFMGESPSGLTVSEIAVHKVDGAPRYNWQEKGGVWTKVALK